MKGRTSPRWSRPIASQGSGCQLGLPNEAALIGRGQERARLQLAGQNSALKHTVTSGVNIIISDNVASLTSGLPEASATNPATHKYVMVTVRGTNAASASELGSGGHVIGNRESWPKHQSCKWFLLFAVLALASGSTGKQLPILQLTETTPVTVHLYTPESPSTTTDLTVSNNSSFTCFSIKVRHPRLDERSLPPRLRWSRTTTRMTSDEIFDPRYGADYVDMGSYTDDDADVDDTGFTDDDAFVAHERPRVPRASASLVGGPISAQLTLEAYSGRNGLCKIVMGPRVTATRKLPIGLTCDIHPTTRLRQFAAVRIEVRVSQRINPAQESSTRVDYLHETCVVRAQWSSRVHTCETTTVTLCSSEGLEGPVLGWRILC
uniref:Uncharacterized protein n=1 Tax=Timema shepardi TaxID=629360 RepID=A0A7R9B717_TIMSH|nr:unnamed protein product [Timema shepardi]